LADPICCADAGSASESEDNLEFNKLGAEDFEGLAAINKNSSRKKAHTVNFT
jgi:hypothetical protein